MYDEKCWRIVMYIRCKRCGYKETINKRFFFKILGGAVSGFGFYAWVAYIFVGTGLALPICCAIVAGGLAMAAFSNEIAEWVSFRYDCPDCKNRDWEIIN